MTDKIGHRAIIKQTLESGLIVGEISELGESWKVQFSFDSRPEIVKLSPTDLNIMEELSNELFVDRLVRDLKAKDLKTRLYASQLLCDFIEFSNSEVNFDFLTTRVESLIQLLSAETDINVNQKIAEGIFEFIWLDKLHKEKEEELIIRLAKLNSDALFSYLDDEDYLKFPDVKNFIQRKNKEWNTSR